MKIVKSLLIVVAALAVVGGATYAYFSDSAVSGDNTFKSGTLSIDNSEFTGATTVTIPNIAPGDVSAPFSVIIRNDGNMNLGWVGDWQFTGGDGSSDLKNALYIDYAKMEFLTPTLHDWNSDATVGYETDGADLFIENGTGHGPYASFFTGIAGTAPFGVVSFNKFNNNSGMVPGSVYEHAGALKPGYSYKLTIKFGMASGARNEYQNLGPVTAKLQVNATQIKAAALQDQGVPASSAPGLETWMNAQIADQIES